MTVPARRWRPRGVVAAGALLGLLVALLGLTGTGTGTGRAEATPAPAAVRPAGPTTVSLTFDDGDVDQLRAVDLLRQYGMAGTFYVIPGAVDTPHYLTRADLARLAAEGNEIGGHTVSHLDLPRVSLPEARRQICDSRDILAQWGYRTRSFAYPNGGYNPAIERIARGCGYSSARTIEGLHAPGCPDCALAESVPAFDPYAIRVPSEVDTSWTAGALEQTVIDATRAGGAWVPFVIHHVCDAGCGDLSIRPSVLTEFLQWLDLRQQLNLNVVRTVGDTLGGPYHPLVRTAAAADHGVAGPGLERAGASATSSDQETTGEGGFPQCWNGTGFGSNTASWTRTPDAHSGHWAEQLTMTHYADGDAKLLPRFDLGQCSIPVRRHRDYVLSAWYRSSGRAQYSVYYRNAVGRWLYWTSSPFFRASPGWRHAVWRAPRPPVGATAISYGLAFSSNGWLVTDDYAVRTVDPYRDPTPLVGAGLLLGTTLLTMRSRSRRRIR